MQLHWLRASLLLLLLLGAGCSSREPSKSQPRHVSRIVFAKDERIWVAGGPDGSISFAHREGPLGPFEPVAWSDGEALLAVSPTEIGDYVYVVGSSGSIRSLGDHGYLRYGSAMDISRDGRFVLVWIQEDGPDSRRTRVELVPAGGGPVRVIARNVGPPSWSR